MREMLKILLAGRATGRRHSPARPKRSQMAARGAVAADIIVVDDNLPGELTGIEVIARLRKSLQREMPALS